MDELLAAMKALEEKLNEAREGLNCRVSLWLHGDGSGQIVIGLRPTMSFRPGAPLVMDTYALFRWEPGEMAQKRMVYAMWLSQTAEMLEWLDRQVAERAAHNG